MKNHIVCIASEHKGNEFLEECHEAGWRVTLVTREKLLDEPWIWTAIDNVKTVRNEAVIEDYVRAITNLAGSEPIDRIVGLDEFDVLTAARAREHLQLGGMTSSHALRFRDKLTMRNIAGESGVPCPEFTARLIRTKSTVFSKKLPRRGSSSRAPKSTRSAFANAKAPNKSGRL
jgi:biotin carboxylase